MLLYSLGSYLSFDMPKAIVKTFLFWRSFQVIRSRLRSLEGQTLDSLLLLYSWGFQLLIDMHKNIVKTFSFQGVIQVVRGRKRSLEGQTLDFLLLLYSLGPQLSFDVHKAIVEIFSISGGHQRSLEVIKIKFDFILGISITNQACSQKIGRFEPKMMADRIKIFCKFFLVLRIHYTFLVIRIPDPHWKKIRILNSDRNS